MLARISRVLLGFVMACFAAGLTKVLFVVTPSEMLALPADQATARLSQVADTTLGLATHTAVFAAPFALVGAAIGEWRQVRDMTYYVVVGMAIAAVGLLAQMTSEIEGQATIVNNYALVAFLATGFFAGLVYWMFAGRAAGPAPPRQAGASEPAKPAADTTSSNTNTTAGADTSAAPQKA